MNNSLGIIDTAIIRLAIFMAIMLAAVGTKSAGATAVYKLDVTYTNGSITSGPLSFGLSELPASVSATFMLGAGSVGVNAIHFTEADVVSASISFGDATWTENDLDDFAMSLPVSWDVSSLTYNSFPTTSQTTDGIIILNFPLSITGTDIASGQSFDYGYTASTQTVSAAVVPIPAAAWLFGSGLLGMIGIARRKKAA